MKEKRGAAIEKKKEAYLKAKEDYINELNSYLDDYGEYNTTAKNIPDFLNSIFNFDW